MGAPEVVLVRLRYYYSSYLLKRFKDKIGSHTLATEEKASEKKR